MDVLLTTRDGIAIRSITVPSTEVLDHWVQLVRQFPTTGLWPVVLGHASMITVEETIGHLVSMDTYDQTPAMAAILDEAAGLDVDRFLDQLWDDGYPPPEVRGTSEETYSLDESPPAYRIPPIPSTLLPQAGDATILLMPVAAGEEALALLGWGDWNGCHRASAHVAILRRWRERYGAGLLAIAHDTLELVVASPPATFHEALELARDQYSYAPDIVEQGEHPTVGRLASALVGSHHWHFWWD